MNLLSVRIAWLSSRPFLVRSASVVPVKPSSFWRYWRSCSWTADLLLKRLGFGLELLDQVFLRAHLLARVVLDGAGAEPGAEHAEAVGPLGVERAVDGLRRQRGDDQLDGPLPFRHVDLAGHQGLALVHRHGDDPARRGPGRRRAFGFAA